MQQRLPIFAHSSLPPFRTVAFVRVLYVPFIRWRFVCRLFISTVFALARIIFCTCRPRRHQQRVVFRLFALFLSVFFPFCHLPLSSALHLFMLCSHSLGVLPLFALYAVAARAQLIFVDSFFVHVVCVYVCENVLVCV